MSKFFMTTSAAALLALAPLSALADAKDAAIALSNNFAGNSWRQAMLESWEKVASKAVTDGVIKSADAFTTAENQATEQAAQIQNMILQGYDAIVINAASPTALNGAVKEACEAGIVVVSFDGIVTEPCAWRIAIDFKGIGEAQVDYMAARLPEGGNVLEIRGLAGVSVDDEIAAGIKAGLEKHPNLKLVGSVHGDWSQDVAQRAVAGLLPSLPEVAAVVTQGGDGYGAAQAFAAAGRPTPIITLGNRQDELAWWKEQREKDGYETMSMNVAPGIVTAAFWVAQQVLDGQDVPKDLLVPPVKVTQETLDEALANTPVGGVANAEHTLEEIQKIIADAK